MTLKVEIGGNDIGDAILVAAAVVQAVGSVAAILIAVWISHRDRKEVRREAMSDRVSGLAALIFKSEEMIKKPYDIMDVEGWAGYKRMVREWVEDARTRTQCVEALRAIPTHELQSWELVSAVMEMIEALAAIERSVDHFIAENRLTILYEAFGPPVLGDLAPAVNLAAEASARIHNQAHKWSSDKRARRKTIRPRIVT